MSLKKTPDAERLAAALDMMWHEDSRARADLEEAAAELRRLHAENQQLHAAAEQQSESALFTLPNGGVYGLDPKVAKAFGGRPTTAADMRRAAAHDSSCVGAFARARP